FLERDRQIEVGVGVMRIQEQRFPVARLRVGEASEIVVDVTQVEMRFEEVGLEANRTLVEGLRFDELVMSVMNVRQVDQRRDKIRIELQSLSIGGRGSVALGLVAVVQRGSGTEIVLGQRDIV